MGLLSNVWFKVKESIADKSREINVNELSHYIKQTILLVGKAYDAISYTRRVNDLTTGTKSLK